MTRGKWRARDGECAYKGKINALPTHLVTPVSDTLAGALRSYQAAFGHAVPDEVVALLASRQGPLLLEIRQAVALQRPVRSWLARSRDRL